MTPTELKEACELIAYLAGANSDHIRVALAGNPTVCDRLIERARTFIFKYQDLGPPVPWGMDGPI